MKIANQLKSIKQPSRFLLLLVSALLLTGCLSKTAYAPIANGWLAPKAANSGYVVQKGDTIYSIAFAFGLDYHALAAANGLRAPYHLTFGQRLIMTTVASGARASAPTSGAARSFKYHPLRSRQKNIPKNFIWPAHGQLIGRFSNQLGANRGINIAGRLGESVVAAKGGRVVYSGHGVRGYGNLIIIKHSASILSAYAYNRRLLVRVGQKVQQGEQIATMGKNGNSRAMLHFEIRHYGKPVNPLHFLR